MLTEWDGLNLELVSQLHMHVDSTVLRSPRLPCSAATLPSSTPTTIPEAIQVPF